MCLLKMTEQQTQLCISPCLLAHVFLRIDLTAYASHLHLSDIFRNMNREMGDMFICCCHFNNILVFAFCCMEQNPAVWALPQVRLQCGKSPVSRCLTASTGSWPSLLSPGKAHELCSLLPTAFWRRLNRKHGVRLAFPLLPQSPASWNAFWTTGIFLV